MPIECHQSNYCRLCLVCPPIRTSGREWSVVLRHDAWEEPCPIPGQNSPLLPPLLCYYVLPKADVNSPPSLPFPLPSLLTQRYITIEGSTTAAYRRNISFPRMPSSLNCHHPILSSHRAVSHIILCEANKGRPSSRKLVIPSKR